MLTLILSSIGFAVPLQVTQQGRVLDSNGAGVSGLHDLTFRIYDAETSGTLLWEESITTTMTNGYYAAVLGADETNNPLDSNILELYPIYLEFQLDSNSPVATRQAINSAPYAQIAGKAEVATSVNGGSVNATDVQISGNPVIDGTGNWVGQPITVDWNNIDPSTIPSYIADGDDNTQLSKTEVLNYVDGETLNLGASSQVDGSDIVTADSFSTYLPADADTLASLNCATGEIASWDGNSSWVCTSDNTLEWADIELLLNNNPVDLNASTTIGGAEIITTVDDADTLATLSCSDGEIAKYDAGLGDWYCDVDVDTTLTSTEVTTMVEAGSVNLATGSQVNSRNIVSQPTTCSNGQVLVYNSTSNDWACGDDTDTTLTPTEMQTMIEALSLNLQALPQVNGVDMLTADSTLDPTKLDASGSTAGQVLVSDGTNLSWGEASSSGDCTESMVTHGDGSFYVSVDCGTYSYILKTGGATNFWSSTDICTISYIEYDDNGVLSYIDCGTSSHLLHKSHRSDLIASQISSGNTQSCALDNSGQIQCWGSDSQNLITNTPTTGSWQKLTSGNTHSCALDNSGQIQCWGYDGYYQVQNTPTSGVWTNISSGYNHNCAVNSNGTIQCWGRDWQGSISQTPTSGTWSIVSSGSLHNCAIAIDESIQCWGYNSYSQVSDAPTTGTWTHISSGNAHNCAIDSSGTIQCWGFDGYDQVSNAPTGVWSEITSGSNHNCALSNSGSIHCWGEDDDNQVTDAPTTGIWTKVSSGNNHNCAINTTGHVYCWGYDPYGRVSGVP